MGGGIILDPIVKLGIIGTGRVSSGHASAAQALAGVQLSGCADVDPARAMIAAGEIGRIVFATDTWHKPFYAEPRPPWFLDATKGGGMWPMNGSHMIDRMTLFVGSQVVAVKAMVGTYFVDVPATDTGM